MSTETDPIKKIEIIIKKLQAIEPTAKLEEKELENIQYILENNLLDLICDMDLAFDYCKMGGLEIFDKFLVFFFKF